MLSLTSVLSGHKLFLSENDEEIKKRARELANVDAEADEEDAAEEGADMSKATEKLQGKFQKAGSLMWNEVEDKEEWNERARRFIGDIEKYVGYFLVYLFSLSHPWLGIKRIFPMRCLSFSSF